MVPLDRRHAWIVLFLSFVGFSISIYLTYVHYRLHADPGWRSACDIDPAVSCDAVVLSPFGSLDGKPLSIFGAWFYAAGVLLASVSLRGSRSKFPRSAAALLFVGGCLASALSVALALISTLSIGSLCPLCAVLYVINIALTATAWRSIRRSGESIAQALRHEASHWRARSGRAICVAVAALGALGASMYLYSRSAGASTICDVVATADATDRNVELVIYSDFQCPHCRDVAIALRPIIRVGGIRVVPEHYPLDGSCNPNVKRPRHPGSCRRALAAICAGAQAQYLAYSDALFDRGASGDGELIDLAVTLGMDRGTFEACLGSENAARMLRDSIASASARDVHATPTLFLNGRRHVGRLDSADLRCLAKAASWPLHGPSSN